jgi:hypothetical protein
LEDGDGFIIVNLKNLYMYLCVSRSNVYGKNEDQVQQSLLTKYPSWLRHPCPPDKIVCPLQKQSSTREHEKRSTWSWKQSSRFPGRLLIRDETFEKQSSLLLSDSLANLTVLPSRTTLQCRTTWPLLVPYTHTGGWYVSSHCGWYRFLQTRIGN